MKIENKKIQINKIPLKKHNKMNFLNKMKFKSNNKNKDY